MCNITSGLLNDCALNVGGNAPVVYLANSSAVSFTIGTNNEITAVTGNFYKFETAEDSVIDTDNQITGANKNKYFEHKVAFKVASDSVEARNAMEDLALSRLVAVVQTRNGDYKVYGSNIPLGLEVTVNNFTGGSTAEAEYGFSVEMMYNYNHRFRKLAAALEPTGTGSGPYTFA